MTNERPPVETPLIAPAFATSVLERLRGGLVVSCQALESEPLYGADIMARLARAAVDGGAVGIRANTPQDITAIRAAVNVPVIGLWKVGATGVYITPALTHAHAVASAGADIVALDATARPRLDGLSLTATINALHHKGATVLADVATFEEGIAAQDAGADAVATTLSGYTEHSSAQTGPDFDLLARLAAHLTVPVIAEGRITTPEQASHALDLGAHAVVVGGAITRPTSITARFTAALHRSGTHRPDTTTSEEFPA
ncbi:N-acetylmannosamine-6-phosphate 2-epimerase [Streptomyces sp. NPDC001914]|uniref:N-acetylmannosamine-6-phosphate 2-epimerase n=1 Tax=Streptomyces sp. NPDC001914 TaxID=3364623 RepID=UPI0036BFD33A